MFVGIAIRKKRLGSLIVCFCAPSLQPLRFWFALMNYLLVTFIPFHRAANGNAVVDSLWAEDLKGLVSANGNVTIAAPQSPSSSSGWGPGQTELSLETGITFVALPFFNSDVDARRGQGKLRRILRSEVERADIVHSSNYFPPYEELHYAHDHAVRLGKKTLFVVAEDFYDFMQWNARLRVAGRWSRFREQRLIDRLDRLCRASLATASLAFLHTPAAVVRYGSCTSHGMAIRQPVHELADVVKDSVLGRRYAEIASGSALRLVVASRLEPLKGLDYLLRAIRLLKQQSVEVRLSLFGQGSQRSALETLSRRLDLTDTVTFEGSVAPGPAMRARLEEGHIFMMPHLTNDFGRAFWDAMAAGLPVVAFRSAASQDTVRHRVDGIITPMADVEGLADALMQLHADRPLLTTMTAAAQARAKRNTRSIWMKFRSERIQELLAANTR